jgi:Matrixin/Thrombospondin type 3 repeat/Bacterial TSP3 repeat
MIQNTPFMIIKMEGKCKSSADLFPKNGIMRDMCVLLVVVCLFRAAPASAYQLLGPNWQEPHTIFYVDIPGADGLWNEAFEEAMALWSTKTIFMFDIIRMYKSPCDGPGFTRRNGVGFSSSICGDAFGQTTLAVTLRYTSNSFLTQTDIVFNSNDKWNVYSGPYTAWYPISDFRRVAVHELGHSLGLDHEVNVPAIMSPNMDDDEIPQQDDINGVEAIYGATGTGDMDKDGIPNVYDNCFTIGNADQQDADSDGFGDTCDAFPYDPNENMDADLDGIGDNADVDDDNDGMPDTFETQYNLNPLDASDADTDADGDGYSNLKEYIATTDPLDPLSKPKPSLMPWLPLLLE